VKTVLRVKNSEDKTGRNKGKKRECKKKIIRRSTQVIIGG
jgi:hypothetical protein